MKNNKSVSVEQSQAQVQSEAPQSQLVLPYQFAGISVGATLPSVKNLTRIKFTNTAPLSVTDFKDGQEGQEIKILGDGFTTLLNSSKIITNVGANKLMVANVVYTFVRFNEKWIEDECCSGGGGEGAGIDGGFADSDYDSIDGGGA